MTKWLLIAALMLGGAARAEAAGEDTSGIEQTADMLLIGIPVVALGLTFLVDTEPAGAGGTGLLEGVMRMNGEPRHDLGLALLRSTTVSYGLKYAVDEERPNGKDGSFPSAHTAVTFAGAEFIRKEYGWHWGAPAYAAASYVGWSRTATDHHWAHDVLAGAAIGVLSNYDLADLTTAWGSISVKPALFGGRDGYRSATETPSAAPGLKLELRF